MNKKGVLSIGVLVGIEQIIKWMIYKNQWSTVHIIPNVMSFDPRFNRKLSYFHSIFNINPSRGLRLVFLIVLIAIFLLIYDYMKINEKINKIINAMFVLVIAGISCSFLDTLIWNGSLDYIRIHGFFIFDLKDLYITVPEISLYAYVILNIREFKHIDEKKIIKDFVGHVKAKVLK